MLLEKDLKSGQSRRACEMKSRFFWIIIACLFWNWVAWIGSAHGEEGPYRVNCNTWTWVGVSGNERLMKEFAVVIGTTSEWASYCYGEESCRDLARALNDAHQKNACADSFEACGSVTNEK